MFEILKQLLVAEPVLVLNNREAVIKVHIDARKLGFGGIILQH